MLVMQADGSLAQCRCTLPGPHIRRAPICTCCFHFVNQTHGCDFLHWSCAAILIAREARN